MTLRDSDLLNLPDAPDYVSEEPRYTMNEMIALCEAILPYLNRDRYTKKEEPVVGEPFVLLDDD